MVHKRKMLQVLGLIVLVNCSCFCSCSCPCSCFIVSPKKAPDEGATGGSENPSASQEGGE